MKQVKRILLIFALLLAFGLGTQTPIPVGRAEFIRQAAITTGTARSLFQTLQSVAYQGPSGLDAAVICNLDTNSVNLYLGSESGVTAASGVKIQPGACYGFQAGAKTINSQEIFIFTATQQNAELTIRTR